MDHLHQNLFGLVSALLDYVQDTDEATDTYAVPMGYGGDEDDDSASMAETVEGLDDIQWDHDQMI